MHLAVLIVASFVAFSSALPTEERNDLVMGGQLCNTCIDLVDDGQKMLGQLGYITDKWYDAYSKRLCDSLGTIAAQCYNEFHIRRGEIGKYINRHWGDIPTCNKVKFCNK